MVAAKTRKHKGSSGRKSPARYGADVKAQQVAAPAPHPVADQPALYDEAKAERRAAVWQAFDKLRAKANKGDRQARIALVRFCNANPDLWAMLGDAAKLAETGIIDAIAKDEWLTGRAVAREADLLRQRLSRPSQSPLEELAVRRLVAAWVQLNFADSMCGRTDGTIERAKFWLQRQAQAHRLYAAAEKSLLLIRGLIPAATLPCNAAPEQKHQSLPAATDPVSGVNRLAIRNGHARVNGKHPANRLNGSRAANILETIGVVAEG